MNAGGGGGSGGAAQRGEMLSDKSSRRRCARRFIALLPTCQLRGGVAFCCNIRSLGATRGGGASASRAMAEHNDGMPFMRWDYCNALRPRRPPETGEHKHSYPSG